MGCEVFNDRQKIISIFLEKWIYVPEDVLNQILPTSLLDTKKCLKSKQQKVKSKQQIL